MSKTVRQHTGRKNDRLGRRQPRPATRRTGTRNGVIRAAILEG